MDALEIRLREILAHADGDEGQRVAGHISTMTAIRAMKSAYAAAIALNLSLEYGLEKLAEIRQRHAACASDSAYPSIPDSDKKMFNTLATAHCIQVNEDRAWLLDFIDKSVEWTKRKES